MTDKDKRLIEEARDTHYTRWYEIESLIEQADTEEARLQLTRICISKYHKEEASERCY